MEPIKTLDDLKVFAEETAAEIAALKAANEAEPENPPVTEEKVAELDGKLDVLDKKFSEVLIFEKAKGDWKEQDTPESACYKGAQCVQAINEKHRNQNSAVAQKMLVKLGALGVSHVGDEPQIKELSDGDAGVMEKAADTAATVTPLTGDNSAGSFYGSYVIPVEYRNEISRVALLASTMMPKVTRVKVPGITSYWPVTTDEMTWTKVTNQVTAKTEDSFTLARKTLTTCTYASWLGITEEFREDSLVEIGGYIRDMFAEAWGKKFDDLCLVDSTYGALADTSTLELTMTENDFDSLSVDYMSNMVKELATDNLRGGLEYYLHVTAWDTVENEKNAVGAYKVRSPAEGAPYRIKGYPVSTSDAMTSTSAASTSFVGLGNPKHIINGERIPFEFEIFDKTQDTMAFGLVFLRFRTRQAFVLLHPEAWVKLTTSA